jgi:hypothetical protein
MTNEINPFQYNGTSGRVERQTSIDREQYERDSGETKLRAERFMALIIEADSAGLTWKEIQELYEIEYEVELHHGQISGLLSNLHKAELVFISPLKKRHNCYAYLRGNLREYYAKSARYDQPIETKAGKRRKALEKFVADIKRITNDCEWGAEQDTILLFISWAIKELESENEQS